MAPTAASTNSANKRGKPPRLPEAHDDKVVERRGDGHVAENPAVAAVLAGAAGAPVAQADLIEGRLRLEFRRDVVRLIFRRRAVRQIRIQPYRHQIVPAGNVLYFEDNRARMIVARQFVGEKFSHAGRFRMGRLQVVFAGVVYRQLVVACLTARFPRCKRPNIPTLPGIAHAQSHLVAFHQLKQCGIMLVGGIRKRVHAEFEIKRVAGFVIAFGFAA